MSGGVMRRLLKGLSYALIIVLSCAINFLPQTKAIEKPVEIYLYTGKVNVLPKGGNMGSLEFDLTVNFRTSVDYSIKSFNIASETLACEKIEIDGKNQSFDVKPWFFNLQSPYLAKPGNHTAKVKYRCDTNVSNPANVRLQLITTQNHFHCYNFWYPGFTAQDFAETVKFNLDVTIPSDWFLLGSWVPKEYREKPKADGKYKFEREYQDPYFAKLVGGRYEVLKGGEQGSTIWVYTFKGEKGDAAYIAEQGVKASKFYEQYYDHTGNGEYIIAAQTGRRGNGQGIDGGFVMDSPALKKEYFAPEFLAHEMAHSWWGGIVLGADKMPDSRVLSESFAEFSAMEYCKYNTEPSYYKKYLDANLQKFWSSHSKNEPALTNENCYYMDTIVYQKGALVLLAMKNYMGDQKFKQGINGFMKKYSQVLNANKPRPSLSDFKSAMAEANGAPIDEFWNTYFENGSVPIPQVDVSRLLFNGKYSEKLKCKNLESTTFPVQLKVFGVDGKSQEFKFIGDSQEFTFDGAIAGVVNLSQDALIPKPGIVYNTLGTGTVSSALAWSKPQIVCLDGEMMERAQKWADLTGSKIVDVPDVSLQSPRILVGDSAIVKYAAESIKTLPIKSDGRRLTWHTDSISGNFSTTWVIPDIENAMLPIIIDTGTGDLPKDLSWTAIFLQEDGPVTLGYRNQSDGQVSPPKLKYLDAGWSEKSQKVYDCRFDLSLTNAEGFRLVYNGFETSTFKFGKIGKEFDKSSVSETIYLDLKGDSTIALEKTDRFTLQTVSEKLEYDGKAKDFDKPENLTVPKTIASDQAMIKWDGQMKYMYKLDGKTSNVWDTGSTMLLQGLGAGLHKLEIVFYNDGMLGSVQEFSIEAGAKPPKLELIDKKALCKNGKIIVKGITDPGCTIDPPANVNPDGTFELIVAAASCLKKIKIIATNKLGVSSSATIPVVRYAKVEMKIGSKTAVDESGATYTMPVPPQIIKGSIYVPVRFIGERLGAQVIWDSFTKQVTYSLDETTVEIIIDKTEARVNGQIVKMSAPALIVGGSTLVPARFVAEALGASIKYNAQTKVVIVEYPR